MRNIFTFFPPVHSIFSNILFRCFIRVLCRYSCPSLWICSFSALSSLLFYVCFFHLLENLYFWQLFSHGAWWHKFRNDKVRGQRCPLICLWLTSPHCIQILKLQFMMRVSASMCFMTKMTHCCPSLAPIEIAGTSQMYPLPLGISLLCSHWTELHCPHSPYCPL